MQKIRRNDEVVIIAGRDRGRRGRVLKVLGNDRVYVQGCNLVKKHTKPNPMQGSQGGIVEKEASLHVSNVMLYNPETGKPSRVGFRILADGKKVRYFKNTGEVVDR